MVHALSQPDATTSSTYYQYGGYSFTILAMWICHILGVIFLFITLASGVLVEDAFSKEVVNHIYSKLELYQVINHDTVVGFSALNQFVNIKLDTQNQIRWTVELDHLDAPVDNFKVVGLESLIYLYSQNHDQLYLYNSTNGVYKRSVKLQANPIKIEEVFNNGLMILDSEGNLQYVDHTGVTKVIEGLSDGSPSDFHVCTLNGVIYIITGTKLSKLLSNFELESLGNIRTAASFKDGLIVTSTGIYKLNDDDIMENVSKVTSASIINANYLFSAEGNQVTIYYISDENEFSVSHTLTYKSPILNVQLKLYALSDFIIVTHTNFKKDIYDLTDFMMVNDPESIKHVWARGEERFTDDFIVSGSGGLRLIILNSKTEGLGFDLMDGSLSKEFNAANQYTSTDSKYLIINKPKSEQTINEVHHLLEDADGGFLVIRWISRVRRHLAALGKSVVSLARKTDSKDSPLNVGDFGFAKLIVFFDLSVNSLVAFNSEDGQLEWKSAKLEASTLTNLIEVNDEIVVLFGNSVYHISARDGSILKSILVAATDIVKINTGDDDEELYALKQQSSYLVEAPLAHDAYFIDLHSDTEVSGQKIAQGTHSSYKTWTFTKEGESVVKVVSKPQDTTTSSLGIALADKSVLYKYLYSNTVAILTKDQTNVLKLYLVDGITGNLLYTHSHSASEVVDLSSVNLIIDDNWIIYSFFVKSPTLQQRINVVDLFDSTKAVKSDGLVSSFEYNSTVDSFEKKSFIYPERIISLGSTQSVYGVTLKSIIAVTELGAVVEIPKFMLNSRRIDDRELTAQDYQSDFRMVPYEPVIQKNNFQVLNHKHRLTSDADGKILIKPTNFESTSVVCYFNKYNQFCTYVQPSSSFDLLSKSFDALKLIITIVILFAAYLISNPFVSRKRLDEQWLEG